MQNAAAGADDGFGAMLSELISLLEQVQASISLIDGAIARETALGEGDASNIVVLDDVTPQYMKASYALQACNANLDTALQSLLDAQASACRPPQLAHG